MDFYRIARNIYTNNDGYVRWDIALECENNEMVYFSRDIVERSFKGFPRITGRIAGINCTSKVLMIIISWLDPAWQLGRWFDNLIEVYQKAKLYCVEHIRRAFLDKIIETPSKEHTRFLLENDFDYIEIYQKAKYYGVKHLEQIFLDKIIETPSKAHTRFLLENNFDDLIGIYQKAQLCHNGYVSRAFLERIINTPSRKHMRFLSENRFVNHSYNMLRRVMDSGQYELIHRKCLLKFLNRCGPTSADKIAYCRAITMTGTIIKPTDLTKMGIDKITDLHCLETVVGLFENQPEMRDSIRRTLGRHYLVKYEIASDVKYECEEPVRKRKPEEGEIPAAKIPKLKSVEEFLEDIFKIE